MAVQAHKSKYALKREGKLHPRPNNIKLRRFCDFCGTRLRGRKQHGFVSGDGRRLACGGCKRP